MKKVDLMAGAAGLVFAVGLGISGMTQPLKVAAFLDVTDAWDPSLAFVMMGAIGVHVFFARRRAFAGKTAIDARLLTGATLFGVGWGIAGYCPGPAVVSVATLSTSTLAFVVAMLVGMAVFSLMFERREATDPAPSTEAA